MLQEKTFYFIKQQYFEDFPDMGLMKNHETIKNKKHDRPCYYMIQDNTHNGILWMIPLSSQNKKYHAIYDKAIDRYGKCDTLSFGKVLGKEKTFLIQNIFPVTEKYLKNQYIRNDKPVTIIPKLQKELSEKVSTILVLSDKQVKITFTDILSIRSKLIEQLELAKQQEEQNLEQSANKNTEQKLSIQETALKNNTSNEKAKEKDINAGKDTLKETANSNISNEKSNKIPEQKELNTNNVVADKVVKPKKVKGKFSLKYCPALGEKAPEKEPAIRPIKRKYGVQAQKQASDKKLIKPTQKPKKKRFSVITPNKNNDRNRIR